jgi:hypothetical protein
MHTQKSKDYPIQEDYYVSSKKNAAASLGAYYLDGMHLNSL